MNCFRALISACLVLATSNLPALAQADFWQESGLNTECVPALAMNSAGFVHAVALYHGIRRSTNNGADWSNIGYGGRGLGFLAVSPSGVIFAGDMDELRRTTNIGASWEMIFSSGDVSTGLAGLHVNAQNVLYVSVSSPFTIGVLRTTDNGDSWTLSGSGILAPSIGPLTTNASGHVFLGSAGGVYRSTDEGSNWSEVNTGLGMLTITAITGAPDGTIYAGTAGAGMYRTRNNGANWEEINTDLGMQTIRSIAVNSAGHVFAAAAGAGVYRSIDGGEHWQARNSGLTDLNAGALAVSPAGGGWPDYLFAGTNTSGTFRSVASTVIPAPILKQPGQNGACLPPSVRLRWNRVPSATSYHLQVSADPQFTSLLFNEAELPDTQYVAAPLPHASTCYWRVRAMNDCSVSAWSPARSFTIMPESPGLNSPPDSARDILSPVTLLWNASPSAVSYRLQVSLAPDFTPTLLDLEGITRTIYSVAGLPDSSICHWRVSASDGRCASDWSVAWSFTTAAVPDIPVLSAPIDGAFDTPVDPMLIWNPAARAETYRLQVSDQPAFTAPLFDRDTIIFPFCRAQNLGYDRVYYWRVNAANAVGTSGWSSAWRFRTSVERPEVPVLLLPAEGSSELQADPAFVWNLARRAISYHLQIAPDTSFASPFLDEQNLPDTTFSAANLPRGTICFWRVNATNPGGTSGWSAVWSFRTAIIPCVPLLESPPDGSAGRPQSLQLRWHPAPGAATYRLQVSRDAAFSSPIIDQSSLTDTSSLLANLAADAMHYWRVRAANASGSSPWSTVWTFRTVALQPAAPALESPSDLATGVAPDPSYIWHPSPGALTYRLQVSTTDDFATAVADKNGLIDTVASGSMLSGNTRYYWRVNAASGAGTSPWSTVWSFRTRLVPPAPPTLLDPPNDATEISRNPLLRWNASAGADSYHLQMARDAGFSEITCDKAGLSGTESAEGLLDPEARYYWRVNAANPAGTSGWSAIWNFRTKISTGFFAPPEAPERIAILAVFPNPFADEVTLLFRLAASERITLDLMDPLGRRIVRIIDAEHEAGPHTVSWRRTALPAGFYFLRLGARGRSLTHPVILE